MLKLDHVGSESEAFSLDLNDHNVSAQGTYTASSDLSETLWLILSNY